MSSPIQGSTQMYDPEHGSVQILNDTDIDNGEVLRALHEQHPEIAALTNWSNNIQPRQQGLFSRDRYVNPRGIFNEMRMALEAGEKDDAVANVLETSEQMAFNRIFIDTGDDDEDDIWKQILEDIDLLERMKETWREVFLVSNCYIATLFGLKPGGYKVSGRSESGTKRKKTYPNLVVPLGVSVLDPLKVVPVGNFLFQNEKLAYISSGAEADSINDTLAGSNSSDLTVSQLIEAKYEPSVSEKASLVELTGDQFSLSQLFLLNPDNVFRITSTRPSYQRFAAVRMKSVFELLDLKEQLRQMDRAHVIGGTNFIIVVKKGSDSMPAKAGEVERLAAQVRTAARVPIIIGDHRIEVEIVTPKLDKTLSPERYNALDSRISSRLWQLFNTGNYASGTANDDSVKLARVVARSMEARRNVIKAAFTKHLIKPIYELNDSLTHEPTLKFYPSRVSLDFDPNVALYIQDLFTQGALSRHTALGEVDIDEEEEASWREREKKWDKLFVPPAQLNAPKENSIPAGTPGIPNGGPSPSGGQVGGGNSNGGGTNRNSLKGGPPRGDEAGKPRSRLAQKVEKDRKDADRRKNDGGSQ